MKLVYRNKICLNAGGCYTPEQLNEREEIFGAFNTENVSEKIKEYEELALEEINIVKKRKKILQDLKIEFKEFFEENYPEYQL